MFRKPIWSAAALLFLLVGCSSDGDGPDPSPTSALSNPTAARPLVPSSTPEATVVADQPSPVRIEPTPVAPTSVPVPRVVTADVPVGHPVHTGITATIFWIGEEASADNDFIANDVSAWDEAWVEHFGGVDDPNARNGFYPASFTPKENPFYCALPYGDYTETGTKKNVTAIYWYEPFPDGESLLKNQWIEVSNETGTAYCQWEDVGPFQDDDVGYVFGTNSPIEAVGIDLSPAMGDFLLLGGRGTVSWQFVNEEDVPPGPWREIVTTRGPYWP